jgi:hypothetical protein
MDMYWPMIIAVERKPKSFLFKNQRHSQKMPTLWNNSD